MVTIMILPLMRKSIFSTFLLLLPKMIPMRTDWKIDFWSILSLSLSTKYNLKILQKSSNNNLSQSNTQRKSLMHQFPFIIMLWIFSNVDKLKDWYHFLTKMHWESWSQLFNINLKNKSRKANKIKLKLKKDKIWQKYGHILQCNNTQAMEWANRHNRKSTNK